MKTRMHPSIILEKLASSFVIIVFIGFYIIKQMLGDFSEKEIEMTAQTLSKLGLGIYGLIVCVIIILLLIFTIFFWISWKNTYLSLKEDNLIIEKGKLFKKITTIHLSDIATINIKRNILEKILGTSNLKIDLNTNNETYNGKLIFKDDKALKLKDEILICAGKKQPSKEEIFQSLIEYKPNDVFKHMLLSTNVVSIILLVLIYLGVILGVDDTSKAGGIILTILAIFIIVVPLVWSLFKSYLGYYNFKCNREDDNIKLSYGALTTYKYNIPIQKINTIIIRQTLQARLLGYYLIEVVNAGIKSEEDEKTIISLYVKEKEKNIIIDNILPEYKNEIVSQKGDKNILKHYIVAKTFWVIVFVLCAPFTHFITLLLIPLLLVIAFIQYKTNKIGNDKNIIKITKGLFNKQTNITKYSNIELIKSKQKVYSKLFNTRSIEVNVVGPAANSSFSSGLFSKETVDNIIKNY